MTRKSELESGCPASRHTALRRGFTLLEIVVALGVLSLLMAFAWSLIQNQITASALPESAARVRDSLFMARSEASMKNRRVRIRFEPKQQHPLIEIEADPIRYPGEWTAVESSWARDPILLDDVQVHTIEMGRPFYLKLISFDETTEEAQEDSEEEEEQNDVTEFSATSPNAPSAGETIELDENRPLIVFEADGSSEWYTIKLTHVGLETELRDEDNQLWVILDGRTGLASVRENVTEEQLADEEFYVDRKNLEFPDEVDPDDLQFQIQDQSASAGGAGSPIGGNFGSPPGGNNGQNGGQNGGGLPGGIPGGLPGGIPDGLGGGKIPTDVGQIPGMGGGRGNGPGGRGGGKGPGDGGVRPGDLGNSGPGGQRPEGGRRGGDRPENGGDRGDRNPHEGGNRDPNNSNGNTNGDDPVKGKDGDTGGKEGSGSNTGDNSNSNIDDDLGDSNLTEEERENIRKGLGGGNNR